MADEKQKAAPEKETSAIKKVLSTKSLGLIKAWEESEKTKVDKQDK